jgi:hypothetical protein
VGVSDGVIVGISTRGEKRWSISKAGTGETNEKHMIIKRKAGKIPTWQPLKASLVVARGEEFRG